MLDTNLSATIKLTRQFLKMMLEASLWPFLSKVERVLFESTLFHFILDSLKTKQTNRGVSEGCFLYCINIDTH